LIVADAPEVLIKKMLIVELVLQRAFPQTRRKIFACSVRRSTAPTPSLRIS
jgi:hypothetical protein